MTTHSWPVEKGDDPVERLKNRVDMTLPKYLWISIILIVFIAWVCPLAGQPSFEAGVERQLRTMFDDPAFERALWGIKVQHLKSGAVLYAENSERLFVPASNMKIVTALAALNRLGPEFRFSTEVFADGPIERGVLKGDLVIRGGGDPSLGAEPFVSGGAPEFNPLVVLDAWAAQLKEAGIKEIEGALVADSGIFADVPIGNGWAADDLSYGYSAEVSGLQFNQNTVRFSIVAAATAGTAPAVKVTPATGHIRIENRMVTVSDDVCECEELELEIQREPGNLFVLSGRIPIDTPALHRTVAVEDPAGLLLDLFRARLVAAGISVKGKDQSDPGATRSLSAGARLLLTHRSETLSTVLTEFLKESRNQYGETLLRMLDPVEREKEPEGGIAVIEDFLTAVGIPEGAYQIADGSGLSRYNLVAPETLIRLLDFAQRQPYGAAFESMLPIGGVDGTIGYRLKATVAEERVHAKTGTLSNVRALSGYLTTQSGDTIIFSMLVNNYTQPRQAADFVVDRALRYLVSLP